MPSHRAPPAAGCGMQLYGRQAPFLVRPGKYSAGEGGFSDGGIIAGVNLHGMYMNGCPFYQEIVF